MASVDKSPDFETLLHTWSVVPVAWSVIMNHVPQLVPSSGQPISIQDLAKQAKVNEDILYRFMRVLSSVGVFKEDQHRSFSHTEMSKRLLPDGDLAAQMPIFGSKHFLEGASKFDELLRQPTKPAFELFSHMPVFQLMEKDHDFHQVYVKYTTSMGRLVVPGLLLAGGLPDSGTVASVGSGGYHNILLDILHQKKNVHGIVFEAPFVASQIQEGVVGPGLVAQVKEAFGAKESIARHFQHYTDDVKKRVKVVSGHLMDANAFKAIANADTYILFSVLSHKKDADAKQILSNLYNVMKPTASVMVIEGVMPHTKNAFLPVHQMDITHANYCGSKERTREEWTQLLSHGNGFNFDVTFSEPLDQQWQLQVIKLNKK